MFCTRCGVSLEETAKFCSQCGVPAGQASSTAVPPRTERLTRPAEGQKIAGVCAGFARYWGVDVTLVRILWIVLVIWPIPLIGIIGYIVAWIVMPVSYAPPASAQPAPAPQ
jgi:phage shock protein C